MIVTNYKIESSRLPCRFDGFKIAQVSDLHDQDYKGKLLEELDRIKPDITVITGDMIDRENHTTASLKFAAGAVKISPVYYVNGNHESVLRIFPQFRERIISYGVHVLENQTEILTREQDSLVILGMNDPRFFKKSKSGYNEMLTQKVKEIKDSDANAFVVLLSHRPEMLNDYAREKIDLAFTGHAHGGQVRLPFVGAIFAPSQGFFPKLTGGVHRRRETQMIISRGLGKSNFVPRINIEPELIVATLACKIPETGV